MGEEEYDTPWEFARNSIRFSLTANNALPQSRSKKVFEPKHSPREQIQQRPSTSSAANGDENNGLLEYNVDRREAEERLENGQIGDFLLRARGEGSAALSIRATSGVLHIKIERRQNSWIVGEGPAFKNLPSITHYYKRHPLPIRGTRHIVLNQRISRASPKPTTPTALMQVRELIKEG